MLRIFSAHARNGDISASDLRTFSVDFFHRKSKTSTIFLLRFIWPTNWPRKRANMAGHAVNPPPSLKILRLSVL